MAPAFRRFITLDGHRLSRLYRGLILAHPIILAQILTPYRAKRDFRHRILPSKPNQAQHVDPRAESVRGHVNCSGRNT